MNIEECIQRGGSKLEITRTIIEKGLDAQIPVPRSAWKYYGEPLDPFLKQIASFQRPLIVRGSHPNDYNGFIDVIPTVRNVITNHDIERAIRKIEYAMREEEVKIHCADWGQMYTPEAHILVQEQISCDFAGTMLRNPHTGSLCLEYREKRYHGDGARGPVSFERVGTTPFTVPQRSIYSIPKQIVDALCNMYEKVENEILDPQWTYQIEFGVEGLDTFFFFQARQFKQKKPAENFKIPYFYDVPHLSLTYFEEGCFGITSPEGMELEFFNLFPTYIERENPFFETKDYGLILENKLRQSLPLWTKLGKMKVLCAGVPFWCWQSHDMYRLVKRAEYAMLVSASYIEGSKNKEWLSKDQFQARYISNGKEAILVPTEYLK